MLNDEPAKVRCRTCHSDHDYRHELPPPPKVDPRKAALFNQVLEQVTGGVPGVAPDAVGAGDGTGTATAVTEAEVIEAVSAPVKAKGRSKKA